MGVTPRLGTAPSSEQNFLCPQGDDPLVTRLGSLMLGAIQPGGADKFALLRKKKKQTNFLLYRVCFYKTSCGINTPTTDIAGSLTTSLQGS